MQLVTPSVVFLGCTLEPLRLIELAGRTAYKSESKITVDSCVHFIEALIKSGHESVLEHASVSFKVICDRGVTHELVRHRLASYTQESTRYCNYYGGDGIQFILPPEITDIEDKERFIIFLKQCENLYNYMIENKFKPQIARQCLPNCLKTEIVVSANFREWRHILKLRTAKNAHPHIRFVMFQVLKWFENMYPVIVSDITNYKDAKLEGFSND